MAQQAVRHIKEGDAIVNNGSVTGLLGSQALLDYSITKGGIHAFTRSLASHLSAANPAARSPTVADVLMAPLGTRTTTGR